jgi:MFS family permease
MILLDNSVIFTALAQLAGRPAAERTTELSWVQDAYTLVFGGLLLLGARAGDLLGRRRVFVFGLLVFSIASLLIGLAPSGWWAITGRAVQGIGAAIVAPASLSLLTASFPEGRERTRAVALYGATAGIGASLGLVIGGALAHWISWRAGFFVNVPIGTVMIVLAPRFLPETGKASGRFDVFGALSATLGVAALVFGIINTAEAGRDSPVTATPISAGVVLLIVFVLIERKAAQPIMPLRLFASRRRTGAYVARFLYLGAMIAFFFFTTQFLQEVLGFDPLQAGMGFLPMTAINFAVAMSIPRLVGRMPGSLALVAGILITLAGMFWLSRAGVDSSYLTGVALPMILIGAGQGLAFRAIDVLRHHRCPGLRRGGCVGPGEHLSPGGNLPWARHRRCGRSNGPDGRICPSAPGRPGQRRTHHRQCPAAPRPGRHRGAHPARRPGCPPQRKTADGGPHLPACPRPVRRARKGVAGMPSHEPPHI